MLVLEILQGPNKGERFELPSHEPQLIGRSSEALPITDSTVSRRHAELTPDDGAWYVRDLESANGTFVNGSQIQDRVQLSPGDQIRCGSTVFVFVSRDDDDRSADASAVELLNAEAFDVTVEGTIDASEDSMIMGVRDPIRAARNHLRVIYDLTELTSATFERDELLERAMDLIFEEFQPDRGFILLQESASARPEPIVVRYKVRPRTLDEGRIPVSRTIIQHTLEQGKGILSTNAMNDERFRSGDSIRDYGIRSAICVPIRSGEQTFGVIHIDSSMANFTFSESQLLLLSAIGQHVGLAMRTTAAVASHVQTERLAAMGRTVTSLSHSIKNILQGLRGGADAVELALSRDDLDMAKEGWPILSRNLDRIYTLTLNMLAYSKPPSLEIELASVDRLVGEVVELLQPQCEKKRIVILQDHDEDMPPIPMDPNAMHQVLMNLLTNAIEAVTAKRGRITVRTRFDQPSHAAQIMVIDNGPGVAPEWRERIFEAFSSNKGQRGTGLGLAVTRKIVREHGGEIALDPDVEDGATFIITLPSDAKVGDSGETRLPRPVPRIQLDDEF